MAVVITVRFGCGHEGHVSETASSVPVCEQCGDKRVSRTKARPPRFVGACSGPYAESKNLSAAVVNVAPGGALNLKASED